MRRTDHGERRSAMSDVSRTLWSPPSLALVTLSFSENVVARLPATLVLCASAMAARPFCEPLPSGGLCLA